MPGRPNIPDKLALIVGDTAHFWATGAVLAHGQGIVELRSPSLRTSTTKLASGPHPAGLPNTVTVEALQPGQAGLKLFTSAVMMGRPPETHLVTITVSLPPKEGEY